MRIIRGKYKTRRFKVLKNFPSRPTTDFAKEGLFNILENRMVLHDLQILDLCAGTGNISIEFLSRECGHVTAVDKNYNCIRHVQQLSRELECKEDLDIVKGDIIKFLQNTDETFDIIFADPPYAFEDHHKIAELTVERDLLTDAGLLVIEHGKHTDLSDITQFRFSRKYGNVVFSFFTKNSDDE